MSEEVAPATADLATIAALESQLAAAHESQLLAEQQIAELQQAVSRTRRSGDEALFALQADVEVLVSTIRAFFRAPSYGEAGRLRVELHQLARAHPGTALADEVRAVRAELAQFQAERRRLLVVAYAAYELSMEFSEFDAVVDSTTIEALDTALLNAFPIADLFHFAEVGQQITTAMGGHEAMLKARQG